MKKHQCPVPKCTRDVFVRGYCNRHYRQVLKYGEPRRNRFDKNDIIIHNNCAEIILRSRKQEEIGRAIIDLKDIDLIKKYKWGCGDTKYARTTIDGKIVFLHNLLIGKNKKYEVDHIDRDRLNNKRNNLRHISRSMNGYNRKETPCKYSGVVGVRKTKQDRWCSRIKKNGKDVYLGTYAKKEVAIKVRKLAEIKYFGELK